MYFIKLLPVVMETVTFAQLSPEVSRVVYSFPAKLLKEKLVSLAKAHFNLATTVITGIPMKVWSTLFRNSNSCSYGNRRNKLVVAQQTMMSNYCIMLICTVTSWEQVCHHYHDSLSSLPWWFVTLSYTNSFVCSQPIIQRGTFYPIGFHSATTTPPVANNSVVSLKWATPRSSNLGKWPATPILPAVDIWSFLADMQLCTSAFRVTPVDVRVFS